MAFTRAQLDAFNSRQLDRPTPHVFTPHERGGAGCRYCVLSDTHPVHTTPTAENVIVLGGRRRAKGSG